MRNKQFWLCYVGRSAVTGLGVNSFCGRLRATVRQAQCLLCNTLISSVNQGLQSGPSHGSTIQHRSDIPLPKLSRLACRPPRCHRLVTQQLLINSSVVQALDRVLESRSSIAVLAHGACYCCLRYWHGCDRSVTASASAVHDTVSGSAHR